MRFLTRMYRNLKLGIASIGGIAGVTAVIAGIVFGGVGGTVLIIGGSLWIVSSGFSIFDSVAAHSAIKKDVDRLEDNVDKFSLENITLTGNVVAIQEARDHYIQENKKLAVSIKKSEEQVQCLSELKIQYEDANREYSRLLHVEREQLSTLEEQNFIYAQENSQLHSSLQGMQTIKESFERENNRFKEMIYEHDQLIASLTQARDNYIQENEILSRNNEENAEQLSQLQSQVAKLRDLYNNSRELLINLSTAGDMFSQFGDTINTSVVELKDTHDGYTDTLTQMRGLIEKLKASTFGDIDINGDGAISKEEFEQYINK